MSATEGAVRRPFSLGGIRVTCNRNGVMPCRHLRPYSVREHTVFILNQSGDIDNGEKEGKRWAYSIPGPTQRHPPPLEKTYRYVTGYVTYHPTAAW